MAGTIKHQWNGTVLTIESDSGVSSCDLKGERGDDGPRGPQGAPGSTIVEDCQKLGGVAAENYALKTDTVENANKLGNVAAESYALKTGTVENANKLGNVAAESYALKTDTVENANNLGDVAAENYALKTDTVENANKLGNVAAANYALKTDTIENANKLGNVAAESYALKTDTIENANKLGNVAAESYALKTDTVENANKLGNVAAANYALKNNVPARNLLDNSDFTNPVNQRGKTTYSTGGYTIDRWLLYGTDITMAISPSGITINTGLSSAYLQQRMAKGLLKADKTYSAYYMDADGTISEADIITSNSDWEVFEIVLNAGETKTIVWAALYEGSYTADTLPPYVPKGYAAELAECLRYYNIIPYDMDDYYVNANTEFPTIYPVSFPEMRIIPTVTLKENWNTGSAGVSVGYRTKSSLGLQVAATNSRVAWHGKIELNAEL